ncbi:MAG: hypothetical protein AVDCRST_MAG64-549, partial [uncultured Phycisphaerae bacterium]
MLGFLAADGAGAGRSGVVAEWGCGGVGWRQLRTGRVESTDVATPVGGRVELIGVQIVILSGAKDLSSTLRIVQGTRDSSGYLRMTTDAARES